MQSYIIKDVFSAHQICKQQIQQNSEYVSYISSVL